MVIGPHNMYRSHIWGTGNTTFVVNFNKNKYSFFSYSFQAKIAARRYARTLEKLGFRARFHNFRVVNVLGTCSMPWAIKIVNFSEKYREAASYEPELHPGVTYKLRYPKATLKIFSTGSITVTGRWSVPKQCSKESIQKNPWFWVELKGKTNRHRKEICNWKDITHGVFNRFPIH